MKNDDLDYQIVREYAFSCSSRTEFINNYHTSWEYAIKNNIYEKINKVRKND